MQNKLDGLKFSCYISENKYDYLPTTVNVCSELMKLILCILVSLCVIKKGNCYYCLFPKSCYQKTVELVQCV